MKLEDIERAAAMMEFLGEQPHPVRVELTEADYQRLLAEFPQSPPAAGVGVCTTLVSFLGLPIFYGEESVVVYSTGQRIPLPKTAGATDTEFAVDVARAWAVHDE